MIRREIPVVTVTVILMRPLELLSPGFPNWKAQEWCRYIAFHSTSIPTKVMIRALPRRYLDYIRLAANMMMVRVGLRPLTEVIPKYLSVC
jgi:hypothetical protein